MAGKRVNQTELCAILGVHRKTLTVWSEEGMPGIQTKGGRGGNSYNTAAVIKWWILRETKGGIDLDAERAKLARAQAETARLKNEASQGNLIALESAKIVVQRAAYVIRQQIVNSSLKLDEKNEVLLAINALGRTDFSAAAAIDDDEPAESAAKS